MGPPYKHFSCYAAGANRYVPQEVQLQLSRGCHQPPHPGLLQVDGGSSGMRGRLGRRGARYQASPPESQGRRRLSPEGLSPSRASPGSQCTLPTRSCGGLSLGVKPLLPPRPGWVETQAGRKGLGSSSGRIPDRRLGGCSQRKLRNFPQD